MIDAFQALADPRRREIIEMIAHNGELSATEISDNFDISPPAISQHLRVLREANLVQVEKRAQQRIYQINPNAMHDIQTWAQQMTTLWNQRFDALERLLEKEKKGKKHDKHKRS